MKTRTTKKVNKTQEQRQEDAKKARINFIRFLAFTDIYDYERGSDFSLLSGFLKGDVTKATQYYIDKKWMSGTATRASSYTGTCKLDDKRICPIIAFTPIKETEKLIATTKQVNDDTYFWREDEDAENARLILTSSLNSYCRAFPKTLSCFSDMDMDDFPCDMPTEEETEAARKLWENNKIILAKTSLDFINISFIHYLFKNPAFKDFFRALPSGIFACLIEKEFIKYEKLQFLNQEDYDYAMFLLEYDDKNPYSVVFEQITDKIMFYNEFLRKGDIEYYKRRMHKGCQEMLLLQAIEALQNGLANDAVQLI